MSGLIRLPDGHCSVCDAVGPLLDELCEDCVSSDHGGPLSPWMVRLLFESNDWRTPTAWRDYLDATLARPGANDNLSALTLDGPMWARRVLEAVS